MHNITVLTNLEDYFQDYSLRNKKGVYFSRICGYSQQMPDFINRFFTSARVSGVFIEGRLQNPDEKNLGYYEEIMGSSFQFQMEFLTASLRKWLPRLNEVQRNDLAAAIYDTLDKMRLEGKNENMLKNAYIKFMCWLYYKFERMLNQLGREKLPKILFEGSVSGYELRMLHILASAGCDILLLEYDNDAAYLKADPESRYSSLFMEGLSQSFPQGFSVLKLQKEQEDSNRIASLYGRQPEIHNCTNAWITGVPFEDISKSVQSRGTDAGFFYNCFIRICGVEDKALYENDLFQLQLQLKNNGRRVVVEDRGFALPLPDETDRIRHRNYTDMGQMLSELSGNIQYSANHELQQVMKKNFIELLNEEYKRLGGNINRYMNKAVFLLCWLNRYQGKLFEKWKVPEVSVFIFLGACKNENEALFLRFLSRLPIDVLVLTPNLNVADILEDPVLFDKKYDISLNLERFPLETTDLRLGTAAYHAEQDLNSVMYQDTGLYRDKQYSKAVSMTLQTMYEEIAILWAQEVKYRPNFSVVDDTVTVPVIFAKVCGVKEGNAAAYWQDVKKLITKDSFVMKKVPFVNPTDFNPIKQHSTEFLKNGKILKKKVYAHPSYQYSFLREEMQDYILDKIQLLIDRKTIRGTFENGTEYTILSVLLNLDKEIIRLIQKLDFTKILSKIICIDVEEAVYSLEDSIILAFLNLAGFDVVLFTPTGYRNIEQYYNGRPVEEHQIGEYLYDMHIPDFNSVIGSGIFSTWRDKIFKKGN